MSQQRVPTALGTEKVSKLLMQYAVPSIIAMTASSLYNMVDSIFIGQGVGAMAISGIAITFPLMNITAAFGSLVGVGAATLTSVKLGQKDYDTARRVLGNVFVLNILLGVLLTVVTLPILDPILYFFGASDNTIPYARDYMQIILIGNMVTHLYFGLNALLRSSGHPEKAMFATIATVLVNTILDPIFIYVFDLGIRGAAIATILSQMTAMAWQCRLFCNKNEILHFERGIYKLRASHVSNIIGIGMSPFLMNSCSCLIVILFNNSLAHYGGDMAVGAFGIVNRISFLFFMVIFGINQGMQPIAGYNYGAQQYDRLMQVVKYAMICATIISILGWLVSELIPGICARAFTTDQKLIDMSEHGLRLANIVMFIIGYQIVVTNFFQSIGKARVSIFLSLSRQLIFLLPLLLILPPVFGLEGVWYSLPASDLTAAIVTFFMMSRYMKKLKAQQKAQEHE